MRAARATDTNFTMRIPSCVLPLLVFACALSGCGSSQPRPAGAPRSTITRGSVTTISGAEGAFGGSVPGPLASGSYVSCSSLGPAVAVADPSGDMDTHPYPRLAARFPSVDLTMVRVAVSGNRLCVNFTAKAPPTPRTFYIFDLVTPGSTTGPSLGIDVIFWSNGARQVALKYPGDQESPNRGVVPAQVGIRGDSTSLLIDRHVFPRKPLVPFPRFAWDAEAVGQTGLTAPQQVSDYDPNRRYSAYP